MTEDGSQANCRCRGKFVSREKTVSVVVAVHEGGVVKASAMAAVDFSLEMRCLCFSLRIILLLFLAVPACGFNVMAEGSSATERTTDISLRCRVSGLTSDDEVVRVTWLAMDSSQKFLSEIFSADLTNDRPAFLFSSDWAGRGTYDTTTMANVRLPSRFVSRDFAGSYRCQVDSLMSSGFADVEVNVLYGPGSSMIISPGGRVERREGEQLSLACIAQCNPECSYRWYKAGRLVASSGAMIMTSLTRDQAGLYACQARNEAGRSIKPVDLRVSFPASVLNLNINGEDLEPARRMTMQAYNGVEAYKTVIFTCKVAAWPEPHIEWSNSNAYSHTTNKTRVISTAEVDLELTSSVYEIKSGTCRDNGQYTCKAWNRVGDPSFKTGILNMSCAPFETNHSSNCSKGKEITIIRDLHADLHINMCFFGNPVPMVTMTQVNNKNGVLTTHTGNTSCDLKLNLCNSIFEFNIKSPEQYGEYVVKVFNNQGHFEKRYVVSSQQPPFPPLMFSLANISDTSACFSWNSNFNGGDKQIFSLQIYQAGQQKNPEQNRNFSIEEDNAKSLSKYSLCVFDLHPEAEYEAILSAANRFGQANSLRQVTLATTASVNLAIPIPSWLSVVQTTTDDQFSEPSTTSPEEQIGKLILQEQPTIPPEERIGKFIFKEQPTENEQTHLGDVLNVQAAEVQHEREDNRINVPDLDEGRGMELFRFLDVYFKLNNLAGGKELELWPKQVPGISNYSSNLDQHFLHFAKTQDEEFNSVATSYPSPFSSFENETSSIIVSTSSGESTSPSSSLSPVMLSIICIGVTCVFGVIISFTCIAVLKRQQMRSRYNKKYRQRDAGRRSVKLATVHGSQLQAQTGDQSSINRVLVQRVPSMTCVYNENARLTPPAARRPRLSTPDVNVLRQKETPIDAPDAQEEYSVECIAAHPGNVPFITVDNMQCSCASYLDLIQPETEASLQNCHPDQSLHYNRVCPNVQHLQHVSSSDQEFPNSFLQQTYAKCPSDDDIDISSSYLDLYETLAVRSRSRSPSNIYNPLFFDVTSMKSSTDSNESVRSNKASKRDRTMALGNTDSLNIMTASSVHATNNQNQTTLNKTVQTQSDCVECRPKKTPLRVKLTRAPSGPKATTGTVSESSYELVNVSSRKHLASSMYLPMISTLNNDCVFPENGKLTNYASLNIDTTYEKPKCITGVPPRCKTKTASRSKDNTYNSRIPTETTRFDSETHPDVYSSHYQHYIDIDELSRRRNATTQAFLPQRDHLITPLKRSNSGFYFRDNLTLHYETSGTCISSRENNHKDTYEAVDYVQEDTISYINRDSVSTISTTGTISTYCNESDLRRSLQCSSGSDFDEPRSRKSSSESDRGIKCPRKFSFDSDSSEPGFDGPLFECSDDASTGCKRSSQDTVNDRRDSGVSFNCRHDELCYRSEALHVQNLAKRHLAGFSALYQQEPGSQQDLYEEPVVYEHIYAEVSN